MVRIELSPANNRWLIDPFASEGLGEHIQRGVVVLDDDVGVVAVSSSGQGGVDAAAVGEAVDEENGGVDGAALGGVAGLGVAKFEMLGYVLGWEPDRAGAAGERKAVIGVDRFDGPVVAVF